MTYQSRFAAQATHSGNMEASLTALVGETKPADMAKHVAIVLEALGVLHGFLAGIALSGTEEAGEMRSRARQAAERLDAAVFAVETSLDAFGECVDEDVDAHHAEIVETEVRRLRACAAAIAIGYPCSAGDDMRRMAREALGWPSEVATTQADAADEAHDGRSLAYRRREAALDELSRYQPGEGLRWRTSTDHPSESPWSQTPLVEHWNSPRDSEWRCRLELSRASDQEHARGVGWDEREFATFVVTFGPYEDRVKEAAAYLDTDRTLPFGKRGPATDPQPPQE